MTSRISIALSAIILCLCLTALTSNAQDKAKISFAKITPADFILPNTPIIDSNANAVILSDRGEVHYIGNKNGWFSYVYTNLTRIKILNRKGIDLATVKVTLLGQDEQAEQLKMVYGATYNLENGQIVRVQLDSKGVFRDKLDKERTQVKFSLPAVKEGSIVEYGYTIAADYWWHLPSWDFQWVDYPCLYSEYQVEIPQTLSFVQMKQGVHGYAVDQGSTGNSSYRVMQGDKADAVGEGAEFFSVGTVKHDWVMKDVPAFGDEEYLTTAKNYIDKIDFQLEGTYDGDRFDKYNNSWAQATDKLLKRDDFGAALDQNDLNVDELAGKIAAGGGGMLAQAKAIYNYVSHHFTCTDHYDMYIRTSLEDVIKNNSGTVGDINLLLIALLRKKGYQADPVVLSTREFGFNLANYPLLQKLNYVIVRLSLDGKAYYLDAAQPQLGFGRLDDNCYNGHARIISNRDSGSVYFDADSLKETRFTMVMVNATDKGLEGTWQSTLGLDQSYKVRREIREHGQQQYFKDIQTRYGDDMQISNGGIDSLDNLEEPAKVHYDFTLKQQPDASVLYLTPVIGDGWRKNPFEAAERKYPVELPYAMDETYIFSLEIPDGYAVDERPKSARVTLNGDKGQFEYLISQQDNLLQMRCRLRLNKAWFSAADYSSLRDFFGDVVKKEAEPIVLKKK